MNKQVVANVQKACSHSVPVLVPCAECVEKSLAFWEKRIREECRYELSDELKQAKDAAFKATQKLDGLQKTNDRLAGLVTRLESDKQVLQSALREAKEQIAGMRAQLHAEQASRSMPMVRE